MFEGWGAVGDARGSVGLCEVVAEAETRRLKPPANLLQGMVRMIRMGVVVAATVDLGGGYDAGREF